MRFQHHLKTLCKVLKVNRSSYYKHFSSKPATRVLENQEYRRIILEVYSDYDKCIGAYKLAYILKRDYGINISVGRVYRLMSSMNLPKKSTDRPVRAKHTDNGECHNHLHQDFNQKAPNLVWASDFTYIRVASKWHYLCIINDKLKMHESDHIKMYKKRL